MKGSDGAPLFDEWGTAIWAEASGEIRGGGILVQSDFNDSGAWQLDCMGFSGYPQGIPWVDGQENYVRADPADIVRDIWSHIQSKPGGDLGVVVDDTTTPVRVGEPDSDDNSTEGPYRLNWWETHDLGSVIDDLATLAPFDYMEEDFWDGDTLAHRFRIFYPMRGRRRHDLRFAIGENVVAVPEVDRGGDDYASEVLLLGAGEGRKQVRAHVSRQTGRLRRVAVVPAKDIKKKSVAAEEARLELRARQGLESIESFAVTNHPHAELGSFSVGDEVRIQGETGWFDLDMWARILEMTIVPESDTVTLKVQT